MVKSKSKYRNLVKVSPNVLRKTFHSDLLERDIRINVTTQTIRLIRKYGSFDNYILLHKPEKMVSMFGEYLRNLMVLKLNQPDLDFKNAQLFGMEPNHYEMTVGKKFKKEENLNKEWRYKDVSHFVLRPLN